MLADRDVIGSPVQMGPHVAGPLNGWAGACVLKNIECCFAELESSQRVPEDVSVAHIPVSNQKGPLTHNRFNILLRQHVAMEKVWFREIIGTPRLNYRFFEGDAATRLADIDGRIRQFFTGKENRPPFKKSWRLTVVSERESDSWVLEHGRQVCCSALAGFKFAEHEGWDRYARGDLRRSLSGGGGFFRSSRGTASFHRLAANYKRRSEPDQNQQPCVQREPALYPHILIEVFCLGLGIWGGRRIVDCYGYRRGLGIAAVTLGALGLLCTLSSFALGSPLSVFRLRWLHGEDDCENQPHFHSGKIVPRKYLTPHNYWGTVIDMANVLNTDKQIGVISALTEGSSIRSIERMTGVHRDTIMRLGVKVGEGCARLMDSKMRGLPCTRLELDEIWGFVGKKEKNVRLDERAPVGNVWTFCAIDADTKLVPAFKVGDRGIATAKAFVQDVASRMRTRVQISTDGLRAYVEAVESAFGSEVDYAQIIKTYGHEEVSDNRRYSAPEFVSSEKKVVIGNPDQRLISTSYVERLNATTRLHMRRLTRLTLAFSKKRENFEAAVALHFAYYNFVKRHNTLRCTPAMAAGVERDFWSVGQLLEATT